jgi:hypothetical protein
MASPFPPQEAHLPIRPAPSRPLRGATRTPHITTLPPQPALLYLQYSLYPQARILLHTGVILPTEPQ